MTLFLVVLFGRQTIGRIPKPRSFSWFDFITGYLDDSGPFRPLFTWATKYWKQDAGNTPEGLVISRWTEPLRGAPLARIPAAPWVVFSRQSGPRHILASSNGLARDYNP